LLAGEESDEAEVARIVLAETLLYARAFFKANVKG
jgi:hypothetical protein